MSAHHDEQQELENAKHLWKNGGKWLFAVLVIIALGYLGHTFYSNHLASQHNKASLQASQIGSSNEKLTTMQSQYPNSPATTQASLIFAANLFNQGKYDETISIYRWILEHNQVDVFQAAAVQNLANVYLQQQKYDDALAVLNTPVASTFQSTIEETKGDVYAAQSKNQEALTAYQAALDKLPEEHVNRELIQAKINMIKNG